MALNKIASRAPGRLLAFVASLCVTVRAECADVFTARSVPDSIAVPATANRAYRLLVPDGAGDGTKRFPLIVYLHGAGAKGDDNAKQLAEQLPRLIATAEMRAKFPCFVLVPQCRAGEDATGRPNNWVKWDNQIGTQPAQWEHSEAEPSDQLRAAMAALEDVLATQSVDQRRVYVTGISMGGSASWNWAAREPNRFAGALIVCGLSETGKAPVLAKLPIWTFHGSADQTVPVARTRAMVALLKAASSPVKFTEYAGAGHNIGDRVFAENNNTALHWLMEQRRPQP